MKNMKVIIAAAVLVVATAVTAIVQAASGEGFSFAGAAWSLFPPLVAIILALITKEAYSSLFIGIFLGAFMVSGCSLLGTVDTITTTGITAAVSDTAGILRE